MSPALVSECDIAGAEAGRCDLSECLTQTDAGTALGAVRASDAAGPVVRQGPAEAAVSAADCSAACEKTPDRIGGKFSHSG